MVPHHQYQYVILLVGGRFKSMKYCMSCKQTLPVSSFTKNRTKADGLHHTCRECKREHQRRWYEGHRQEHYTRVRTAKRRYQQELRDTKDNKPCTDCGMVFPYFVLDWDHVPGGIKIGNVSTFYRHAATKKYRDEVEKCELVCANCHRYRTHNRRHAP
jgi:hypothetical protein